MSVNETNFHTFKPNKPIIDVRRLATTPISEVYHGLTTNCNIRFEDGVIKYYCCNEIHLIRYLLNVLKDFKELPITSAFCIDRYYTENIYIGSTINSCFEKVLEEVVMNKLIPHNMSRIYLEPVYEEMMKIIERVQNEVVYDKLDYATSLNILDFNEIQMDPELLESMVRVQEESTQEAIANSYDILDNVIRHKASKNNMIVRGYISKTINPNQVRQMLGPRGFVTEVDNTIFKTPVAASYYLGLYNMYSLGIESRSAAKALALSTKAIQDSEYFARELQKVTMSVEKLVDGDCGNTEFMEWTVRGTTETGKSDIKNMIGKWYVWEEGNEQGFITNNHTHLEGKTIKIRSAHKCKHKNKNSICTACFGLLSYSVPLHSNIGHLCSTTVTQKLTQSLLSTKHLTMSAVTSSILLDTSVKKYFVVKNKDGYAFRANVLGKVKSKLTLTVDAKDVQGFKNINEKTNVYKLNPARISNINSFILSEVHQNGKIIDTPVPIKNAGKRGSFTYTFLDYVKNNPPTLSDNNKYTIDLKDYKSNTPILTLPQVEYSFLELTKAIKAKFKFIQSIKGKESLETQESLLQELFDLINSKLDINIAILEVMVYAFTVASLEKRDFSLGRGEGSQLAKIEDILTNRSLGGALGWEKVGNILTSPTSFDDSPKMDHLLDGLLMPGEVMKDYYGV